MKAVRLHGPRDARYEEVATPVPGPDDVLVRVSAVALCATDVELYDGTMFYLTSGMTRYPFIPGHEWSGEVVEIGSNVRGFQRGDRVVGECSIGCRVCARCARGDYHLCASRSETGLLKQPGAMAEYLAFPRFSLHPVNGLSAERAAFIEPTGVAIGAVRKARVTPADRVAVVGAGPIGLFAIQVARAYGARQIVALDLLEHRRRVAVELGADLALDPRAPDFEGHIAEATSGELVDVVIEATGKSAAWPAIVPLLAPRARVAMTGLFAGERCSVDFDPLVTKEVTIIGSLGGPNTWAEALSLHHRDLVRTDTIITHRFPLKEFDQAMAAARSRETGVIKVLLTP